MFQPLGSSSVPEPVAPPSKPNTIFLYFQINNRKLWLLATQFWKAENPLVDSEKSTSKLC